MSSGVTQSAPAHLNGRFSINGTPEAITKTWTCKKRDGTVVSFDVNKISTALRHCLQEVQHENVDDASVQVTKATVNALLARRDTCPDVETVQRYVIQQLWAAGLFEAAEHYQNYREEHRKRRLLKPVSIETQTRYDAMQQHFPTDLQVYQLLGKFSRWREEDQRRETWHEITFERVMPWFQKTIQGAGRNLRSDEWDMLGKAMYNLEASPAMRVVQMAGPALDRCHVGAYNCSYAPIQDLFGFPEMLYILMQGSGHGFSVENDYVSELPRIKKQRGTKPDTIVVEDDTEAWCNSYYAGLQRWFDGHDVFFDVSKIRPKGARLKTKGGRSSGPAPFLELMTFARNLIKSRQGRYLEDLDCHDLACMTGKIVQVGGVRRASEISLSDLSSLNMRHAKSGAWYTGHKYRSMANNSAVYDFEERPSMELFMAEWLALIQSKAGERGIFNRHAAELHKPTRRASAKWGVNPCAEIVLRPFSFCNLSIAIARPDDTLETLLHKVTVATYFGVMQSLCTNFRYVRGLWKQNCVDERLLGVDINGHADCPLLRYGAPDREQLIGKLRARVEEVAKMLSQRFAINYSAANTTVKPSGDSSVFFDCGSGISARFADYQIRWVRESKDSPIAKYLVDAGVPYADAPESPESLYVFGFPKASPPGATKRNDLNACQQFYNWLEWKQQWAEHSVSATIYVEDQEWLALGALVYEHFNQITGLSFLPKDNGNYCYSPNEELSKAQYDEMVSKFPKLHWAKLSSYETDDMTEASQTLACAGGMCEV